MKCHRVQQSKQKLDSVFKLVGALPDDPETRAHWARYLCVLVSGFIENSVRNLYLEYAQNKSAPYVAAYVARNLGQFQNPKMQNIVNLAHSFSAVWGKELKDKTDGELKDAIDTVVSNRNNIAHGKDVQVTVIGIQTYYARVWKVLEMIDAHCNP